MKIVYRAAVVKHLQKINPKDLKKIKVKVLILQSNPLAGKPLKGEYAGLRSYRVWPLHIIYLFHTQKKTVEIIDIDYRGGVYKS